MVKSQLQSRRSSDFVTSNSSCTAPSKTTRLRQIKFGKMVMMLMMITLAAVVNFSEAKHNQQANQHQSKTTGQQGTSAHQHASGNRDQCSIQKQYRPEGPIGIRYKKQILQGRDMRAEVQDSHMMEAALKKRHFLQMFGLEEQSMIEEDFQLQQLCPSFLYHSQLLDELTNIEQGDAFCGGEIFGQDYQQTTQNAFLSTHFYKPKYLHVQSLSKPQEAFAQGGIQIQLQQPGDQHPKQQDVPRDNSYLNLALNVLPSYELPVQALDAMDNEQTIEGFLFKKAKQTNVDNFNMFRSVLSEQDPRLATLEMFQRNSFTYDDPEHIANLTNGMRPTQIQTLKPQSSIFRYFTQEVDITPQRTSFEECQLLIPKFEIIKITNKHRNRNLEIKTMIASSPELTFYPPNDLEFPIKLKPQESIDIKIAYISETLGLFESIMYIALDDWIFISTFNAYVVPNVYEIYPYYVTDIIVNQSVELELHITNPSSTDTLIIEELYSTEQDVKLKWPHTSHPISTHSDSPNGDSVISHILVPEGGRKHLVNMVFEINRTMDFYVEIHIRTSLHDVLRVPLYYHVHSDVIKFTPNVIDFGLIPSKFDMIKIPIYAKSKIQDPLIIQDILLPLGDQRLDFQMTDFQKAPNSQIIRRNKDLFLGYALVNPVVSGLIESKIQVIVVGQRTNKTFILDVPIIGFVHPSPNVFGSNQVVNGQDSSQSYPLPLVHFDISDHIIQQANQVSSTGKEMPPPKRKVNDSPNIKNAILQTPLIIKNNFKVPIKIKGFINQNPELRVIPENQNHYMQGIVLQPGQSIKYAQVELTTSLLKITQGNKYISIITNNTLIPVSISIFDRGLLCVWDENEHSIGLDDIPFCTNAHEINFDYVALNDIKMKRLKITNINPVNITIEQVAKQQLDDLNIYIEKVVDRGGNQISLQNADLAGETMQSIIGAKRTKRLINFIIQPYQTMQIVLQVLAKDPKQKFSRIDFSLKNGSSKDFSFNYKYHAIAGTLIMVPQVLKFNPSYPGMSQIRPLVARSTFEVPITVKTITSNDMRIIPTVQPVAIRPNNKTEFGALQFDSSKQPILNNMPIPHLGGPQGLPFNNQEIANILSQHIGSFDPQMQQNLMNFLNGIGAPGGGMQQQLPNPHIAMINVPTQHRSNVQVNQIMPVMTPQDIEIFREKQRMWEDTSTQNVGGSITMIQNSQVKEVTTHVTIETNVYQNITIPIRAQIRKPILTDTVVNQEQAPPSAEDGGSHQQGGGVQVEVIDFDYVQVGTSQMRNLKVINPTDEPFFFTLLLTNNENYNKLIQSEKSGAQQTKKGPSPQDKDFYFQLFCGPKLELLSHATQEAQLKDLNLNGKENPIIACQKIQHILGRIEHKLLSDESVLTLRRRLESYLKDLFAMEVQQDQQMAMEKHQKQNMFQQERTVEDVFEFFEEELSNITNLINQQSRARPLDQETLNIYRITHEKQLKIFAEIKKKELNSQSGGYFSSLPDLQTIMSSSWNLLQQVILSRQQQLHQKPQNTTQKQKKIPRASSAPYYRLNNILLNDLIINNDTSKLLIDQIQLIDPFVCSYTGQSFFINPRYQGQVYRVDPRSMLTLKDAIIFQPQSLVSEKSFDMKLLLKNNLTQIHAIDLRGKPGSGFLEILKVLKKAPPISGISQDYYINAHMMYGSTGLPLFNEIQANYIDYTNLSTNIQSQQQIKERLIQNVFANRIQQDGNVSPSTSHLQQREMLIRAANYHRINGQNSPSSAAAAAFLMNNGANGQGSSETSIELNTVPFHLGQEDILIPIIDENSTEGEASSQGGASSAAQNLDDTEYDEENEYIIVNRILERAAAAAAAANNPDSDSQPKTRIQIQTYHKRVLVVQNTGNLPLNVEIISLEDRGCKAQNFIIENCHPFVLKPGETHRIHIGFRTDYTIAKYKRKLILVAKQGVIQEYVLDVNIPVEHLKLANDLMPLTSVEEWQQLFLKLAILAVAFTTFIQVALDVFGHLKFTQQLIPEHEDTIQYFEEHHNFTNPLFRAGTSQPLYKRDFQQSLPPVIREYIPHDQVYNLYQQAQDKLMDNRVTNQKGSQLLLKEVANLCSNKRQFVTIEAQKQAIKFDQETRKVINARNQMYIKEMKEQQAASQSKQQQLQQQQQTQLPQVKEVQHPIITNYYQPTIQQQHPQVSITSDTSLNESLTDPQNSQNILTIKQEEATKQHVSTPKTAGQSSSKQFVISKKLKKEIAQRQREHQEAEERFKQQQKLKEMQEAANRQRQVELEEAAKRIKAQEDERKVRAREEEESKKANAKFKVEVIQNKNVTVTPNTNAPNMVRHHETEYEKRQMTQKLENKSLNTPSKEDSSASRIYMNSQRSPSNSSEIESSLISNPEKAVSQSHPEQEKVKVNQEEAVIVKSVKQESEIVTVKKGQAKIIPRVEIDPLKLKHEEPKKVKPVSPPVVELDLRPKEQPQEVQKLTKEDLRAFFEQQSQDKKIENKNTPTLNSPLIGGASSHYLGGSSIFSFNPLNAFSGAGSQNQTPDTQANKQRPPAASNQPIKLITRPDFINGQTTIMLPSELSNQESEKNRDKNEEEEDEEEEEEEEDDDFEGNQSADFYNLFNTARSLLARPSFGAPSLQSSGPKFLQKIKSSQVQRKKQNDLSNQRSMTQTSIENEEEIKREEFIDKRETQGSLFSGSLFGDSNIFQGPNQPKKQGGFNMQSSHNTGLRDQQPSSFIPQQQSSNNPWSSSKPFQPSFNDHTFGGGSEMMGSQQNSASAALIRNQQQIYPEISGNYPGQLGMGFQNQSSYQSMNHQYTPQPPPGLGYKPQAQGQSLYAQYSSGFSQGQQHQMNSGGIARVSSLHYEGGNNNSGKINNSYGNYTGGNSSGSSSLHYSQSYTNQPLYGFPQPQSHSNQFTPPKTSRVVHHQATLQPMTKNFHPAQAQQQQWPQNPHFQGGMIQPPPGLVSSNSFGMSQQAKQRNMMNTSSSFFLNDDYQPMGTQHSDEDETLAGRKQTDGNRDQDDNLE